MKVSVVVPAYNEENYIKNCLDSLMKQKVKPDEIILVDNNCTDKTIEIASQYPVRIVKEQRQGIIPARNRGFDEALGEVIVRTDADTILPPDWIKRIKEDFENDDIIALSGKVAFYDLVRPHKNALYSRLFMKLMKISLKHETLVGPNMALMKAVWKKVRREVCSDDKEVHEDIDLSIHISKYGKILFDPDLLVYASARRIKKNPTSFFVEYPIRLMKTIRNHRIPLSDRVKSQISKLFEHLGV